ncbi:MAG: hypothetical protein AB7D42_00930 [Candidatus Methanomethylophilaceae archaeon]|nr:hypothetical protein [Candidatus Methanomethylophilaceae archaeon]
MLTRLVPILVIPVAFYVILKYSASKSRVANVTKKAFEVKSDDIQLAFLCLVAVAMFASGSGVLSENLSVLLMMIISMLMLFAVNYVIPAFFSKRPHFGLMTPRRSYSRP